MTAVKRTYLRDNWQDQPNYCEVWCKKATVLESLRSVTQDYGVMLRVSRLRFDGHGKSIGNLFEGISKPITIFYLGDHDRRR